MLKKNMYDGIIDNLLEFLEKLRMVLKTRLDLVSRSIRKKLELIEEKERKRTYLPPICYTLSIREKYV